MESVQVEDPNAIIGLPLMQLARLLGQLGYLRERFA
jgi:predicted house-cleaning NTP pyrophosphatase (Maf/HAM1 superfamily)